MTDSTNTMDPSRIGFELSLSCEAQAWYLITSAKVDRSREELCDALEGAEITFDQVDAQKRENLFLAKAKTSRVCVAFNTWDWNEEDYKWFDLQRDSLRERWPVLLWLTTAEAAQSLVHHAPNVFSFFAPNVGSFSNGEMSDDEVKSQLTALQQQYGLSDAEVIEQAQKGILPNDADHHAWLVLLGQGELIFSQKERSK